MDNRRRNLQVNQDRLEGTDDVDNNGWPTPLNDRSNPLKWVVTNGKRGTTKDFRAMSTSGSGDVPESEGIGGTHAYDEGLSLKVKKTVGNSLK